MEAKIENTGFKPFLAIFGNSSVIVIGHEVNTRGMKVSSKMGGVIGWLGIYFFIMGRIYGWNISFLKDR
jgi:hypothetical protein